MYPPTYLRATSDFAPALKRWGTPGRQGLCSHLAHLWATSDSVPWLYSGGEPPGGRGYVATLPTCGPLLILPPALKRWGTPRRQGLCTHLAHLWAPSDSSLALKRWGPRMRKGLCRYLAHFRATCDSDPCSEAVGIPQAAGVM